jgi:hypothetical protein
MARRNLDLIRSTRHSYSHLDFKDSEVAMTTVHQLPVWLVEAA